MKRALVSCVAVLFCCAGFHSGRAVTFDSSLEVEDHEASVDQTVGDCEKLFDRQGYPMDSKENVIRRLDNEFAKGRCAGRLETFMVVVQNIKDFGICLPKNENMGEATKVFLEWARHNPNKLSYGYMAGFVEAFREAFPCTEKQ